MSHRFSHPSVYLAAGGDEQPDDHRADADAQQRELHRLLQLLVCNSIGVKDLGWGLGRSSATTSVLGHFKRNVSKPKT